MHQFEELHNIIDHIEEAKYPIMKRWMAHQMVKDTLNAHEISTDFFGQYFGLKVIEYAVCVIKNEKPLGNCPVIGVMLAFFKEKNFSMTDVFAICVNFKNAVIEHSFENKILSFPMLQEICLLIDSNFMGVIKEYMAMYYEPHPSSGVKEHSGHPQNDENIQSAEYARTFGEKTASLSQLAAKEEKLCEKVQKASSLNLELYQEMLLIMIGYGDVFSKLEEFSEVAVSLSILIDILENTGFSDIADEDHDQILSYIHTVLKDLREWYRGIFIDQDALNIHFMDKSLISTMVQLQIILSMHDDLIAEQIEFF